MYDVSSKSVNKLNGELSASFVEAAEANSEEDKDVASASNVIETRVPYPEDRVDVESDDELINDELTGSASDIVESKVPIIDPTQADLETDASEQLESFVDVSGMPVAEEDLTAAASDNRVYISSGYSKAEVNRST